MKGLISKKLCIIVLTFCFMFVVFFPMKAFANDITSAQSIGMGSKISGMLTENESTKYYKIMLNSAGRLEFNRVTSFMEKLGIQIYDSNYSSLGGDTLYWDSAAKVGAGNFAYELDAGIYYVKFNGNYWNWDSYYTGAFNFTPVFTSANVNHSENNNNFLNASQMAVSGAKVNGHLSINNRVDYYKITLPSSGTMNLTLRSNIERLGVRIYDQDYRSITGNTLYWENASQTGAGTNSYQLEKGTYYLRVIGNYWDYSDSNCFGKYSINTSFVSSNVNHSEPNNALYNASSVTFGKNTKGQIALNNSADFYRFTINKATTVNVQVNIFFKRIGVGIYDRNGQQVKGETLDWNFASNSGSNIFKFDLAAGTYYLRFIGSWWNDGDSREFGDYNFTISSKSASSGSTVIKTGFKFSSVSQKTYTGKAIKPSVKVQNGSKILRVTKDYTIQYKNNIRPGKATITMKGKGKYSFSKNIYFNIAPKKAVINTVKSSQKRTAVVKYRSVPYVSGYQISYSTSSKKGYKSAGHTNKTTKNIIRISSKKYYYVKVRAYKSVGASKIYGSYSTPIRVKIK